MVLTSSGNKLDLTGMGNKIYNGMVVGGSATYSDLDCEDEDTNYYNTSCTATRSDHQWMCRFDIPGQGDYYSSYYKNSFSSGNDRELPHIVAPWACSEGAGMNRPSPALGGTSISCAIVAGAAAAMQEKNSYLKGRPFVQKSILMASATEDVDGSRLTPDDCTVPGSACDEKDGAGELDVAKMLELADSGNNADPWAGSCGNLANEGDNGFDYDTMDDSGSIMYLFRPTQSGEARITLSWAKNWFQIGQSWYSLLIDIDLRVASLNPGNCLRFPLETSYSQDNTYEYISFNATQDVYYVIEIIPHSFSGDWNYGIAWSVGD